MAYRYGDRYQLEMLPASIEEYIAANDPVRVYDAFVEKLNLTKLGIEWDEKQVGNSEYNPKAMLKLLVYGYSYGQRSSRKLERATYHNLSFIWLMGGLKPDHKTIARFRKENRQALKNVLGQCVQLCLELDLVEGNTLFIDGSKIRANASIGKSWSPKRCEQYLKKIDQHIEQILSECEALDNQEQDHPSLVKLGEELQDEKTLKSKIETILEKLKNQELKSLNTIDPDCVKVKGRQGTHAGYNGQIVVDEKHGLIVHSDVTSESNDVNQFATQLEQAHQTLGQKCQNASADAGYANTDELKKIDDQQITVIVPSKQQAHNHPRKAFDKEQFHYDSQNDCYRCPQGHFLTYRSRCKEKNHRIYQISQPALCRACQHFGVCTQDLSGRRIRRLEHEDVKLKLENQYQKPESQAIYKLRKQKVELPFGHIKRNLGVQAFLLRGREGAQAEMSLLASCFNLVRMMNLIGVPALLTKLIT